MKIVIIIPYFGEWPPYFNVYLKGCANNPWLDVFFFTDCAVPTNYPANVRFFQSSLTQISRLVSEKLNTDIDIKSAYKLCDLRPFYGKLFDDHIVNCDYWGYGDIDLIYGNLMPYIIPRIQMGFDILSSRKELLSGSLTILRNCSTVNNLYKEIPDFLTLLRNANHEALDETAHCNITWSGGSKLDLPKSSFTFIVSNADRKGVLKASFTTICKEHIAPGDKIVYENSQLKFDNEELGYYHTVCNKGRIGFKLPKWKNIPERFYIKTTGFYTLKEYNYYIILSNYRKTIDLIGKIKHKLIGLMIKRRLKVKSLN